MFLLPVIDIAMPTDMSADELYQMISIRLSNTYYIVKEKNRQPDQFSAVLVREPVMFCESSITPPLAEISFSDGVIRCRTRHNIGFLIFCCICYALCIWFEITLFIYGQAFRNWYAAFLPLVGIAWIYYETYTFHRGIYNDVIKKSGLDTLGFRCFGRFVHKRK